MAKSVATMTTKERNQEEERLKTNLTKAEAAKAKADQIVADGGRSTFTPADAELARVRAAATLEQFRTERAKAIAKLTPQEQDERLTQQSDPEAIAAAEEAQRQLEEDRTRANEIIESRGLDAEEVFADYNACLEACTSLEGIEAANCKQNCEGLEEAIIAELLAPTVEYKEQCFLLANIFELVELKRQKDRGDGDLATETTEGQKQLPYYTTGGNASLLVDGDPYRFMNRLTQYPSQAKLYDLTTADLSHLQPMIHFLK